MRWLSFVIRKGWRWDYSSRRAIRSRNRGREYGKNGNNGTHGREQYLHNLFLCVPLFPFFPYSLFPFPHFASWVRDWDSMAKSEPLKRKSTLRCCSPSFGSVASPIIRRIGDFPSSCFNPIRRNLSPDFNARPF